MAVAFDSLALKETLVEALKKEGITVPTDIQRKAIPLALENKDIIAQSETGTGKTLAYLLPVFQRIDPLKKETQVIILAPTHELAVQIIRQIERLSENSDIKATSTAIIGNVNIERQIIKLKEKPHIIVGSSGRILELIKKKKISAHTVKTIILDEADRLIDESNLEGVNAVIKSTLKDRQLMMFSATISKKAEIDARKIMKEPEVLRGEENIAVPEEIDHYVFYTERRDKIEVLRKLMRILDPKKAIAFVGPSDEVDIMTMKLKHHKIKAESIHGNHFKAERKKTMDDFRIGKIQLMIASDLAARGLHIDGISHIFNINLPEDPKDYVHRVGRSGRNGNKGVAITIATENEKALITQYQNTLKIQITEKELYMGKILDPLKKKN